MLNQMLQNKENSIGGYVDGLQLEDRSVRFSGWAVDAGANAPAKAIYVYYGDRIVGAAPPTDARSDIAAGMADQRAGFRIYISRELDLASPDHRLRFFSTNPSDKVYELTISPHLQPQLEELFTQKKQR
jgi:hypothetical protein